MAATLAGRVEGGIDEWCMRCGMHLGDWRDHGGQRAFHPNPATTRGVACGDGWTRVRCRGCGHATTLAIRAGVT